MNDILIKAYLTLVWRCLFIVLIMRYFVYGLYLVQSFAHLCQNNITWFIACYWIYTILPDLSCISLSYLNVLNLFNWSASDTKWLGPLDFNRYTWLLGSRENLPEEPRCDRLVSRGWKWQFWSLMVCSVSGDWNVTQHFVRV